MVEFGCGMLRQVNTNGNFCKVNGKRNSSGQSGHAQQRISSPGAKLFLLPNSHFEIFLPYSPTAWAVYVFKAALLSVENIKIHSLPKLNSVLYVLFYIKTDGIISWKMHKQFNCSIHNIFRVFISDHRLAPLWLCASLPINQFYSI